MPSLPQFVVRKLSFIALVTSGCAQHASGPSDAGSCIGHAPASGLGAYTPAFVSTVQTSDFIFRGTVTQLHAKTLPEAVDATNMAIVHVDQIGFANNVITSLEGGIPQQITLVEDSLDVTVGQQAWFFSQMWEFNGGALGVQPIDKLDPATNPRLATDIPKMTALFAAQPLYARVASSSAVLIASVTQVVDENIPCENEHCADWTTAKLDASAVLCGDGSADTTAFAASNDIAWVSAPKLAPGQDALVLLHHPAIQMPFTQPGVTPPLLVVAPLDVEPTTAEDQVQALLASPPPL